MTKNGFVNQDFRLEMMSKLNSPQMKLMNRLEEPWFGPTYTMCDQLAMAAALNKEAMAKTQERYVSPGLGWKTLA